jgi:hypothetical protein
MPGFNQTGPMGQGSMTGRRMGRCTNFGANLKNQTTLENENPDKGLSENQPESGFGYGRGQCFGFGRGRGGSGRGMGRQNRLRDGN